MLAPAALLILLTHDASAIDWAREAEKIRGAGATVSAANARAGVELARLLDDGNAAVRGVALEELAALPAALPAPALPRVVALLDDDELVVPAACGPLPAQDATAEGLIEAQLRCRRSVEANPPTVSSRARAVLSHAPYELDDAVGAALAARASAHPASALRLARLVRERQSVARPILAAFEQRRAGDDATAALLLLIVATGAAPAKDHVAPLLQARHPMVRRRAALVLLNAGGAGDDARAVIAAELADPHSDVAVELALLGYSRVTPLADALVARLAQAPADRVAVLVALRGASPVSAATVAAVAAQLTQRADTDVITAALETLRVFGPAAAGAKREVLRFVARGRGDPESAHLDGVAAALAAMNATLTGAERAVLVGVYRAGCKDSVLHLGYHDTGLGAWCGAAAAHLARLDIAVEE